MGVASSTPPEMSSGQLKVWESICIFHAKTRSVWFAHPVFSSIDAKKVIKKGMHNKLMTLLTSFLRAVANLLDV